MRDQASLRHAQAMRKEMPEPELRLWFELRASRFRGIKFRRQKVIGVYVADFASNEPKLAVEVDGDTHSGRKAYDAVRTGLLEAQGYRVVRVSNDEVMTNMEGVLERLSAIVDELALAPPPTRCPFGTSATPPEGEGALGAFSLSP